MHLPLFIVEAPDGGQLGLCPMPGHGSGLAADLDLIANAGVTLLLSMTILSERPSDLEEQCLARGIEMFSLPISDWGAPSETTNARWPDAATRAHQVMDAGGSVLAHCMGGQGRSGMAVMRLLVERGLDPLDALARIRSIRPGAVETQEQQNWASAPALRAPLMRQGPIEGWDDLFSLLNRSFAYMSDRIDPPSSLTRLTRDGLEAKAQTETLLTAWRGVGG